MRRLGFALPLLLMPTFCVADTLRECFEAALRRSESIAIAGQNVLQANEVLRQAKGSVLPTLDLTASHLWQEVPKTGIGQSIFPGSQPLVKFTAKQPLFRGLREFAALRQARKLSAAELLQYQDAIVRLYSAVVQGFYSVLSLESQAQNFEKEINVTEKRIQDLKERRRIGRSRPSEVLSVQTTLARLSSELQQVRTSLHVARDSLAFLTGRHADAPLADDDVLFADEAPVQELASYLARVRERPDVQAEQERARAALDAVAVARGAHFPSVDFTGNYYIERSGSLENVNWDVQLALTMPLYAGGVIRSRVRQARSIEDAAELKVSDTFRRAEQEVSSLHDQVVSGRARLVSLERALGLAERNYAEQSREYRLGLVSNLDVLQALSDRAQLQRSADQTRIELKMVQELLETAAARRP